MQVFPAIDLRQGRCVRLHQGRFDRQTTFSEDPLAMAERWAAEGAAWLHIVNLDGALQEDSPNEVVIERILREIPTRVQLGGGLRSPDDIARALDLGAARVILGTLALRQPQSVQQAVQRHGAERIVVALDARDRRLAAQAWREATAVSDLQFARQMREMGVCRCVYTDIARDGTGVGPNLEATAEIAVESGLQVIASGGIATAAHAREVIALGPLGVEGMVVGRALYTGRLRLADLLRLAQNAPSSGPGEGRPC
ncbi:MAG: 1-(5-phosphoribosyl)-5-[(5-phosphoribosylamino)methylideneamino]imidazole-4-carboxamide isomerase [Chloroflexi bacterium]|nr:1-(5-phosphoribosyl)-5-[(5-phosphoribosylamino)methylideneamino]imidazole-4-carboxamide isomerase [Chloroflexota bacterium]